MTDVRRVQSPDAGALPLDGGARPGVRTLGGQAVRVYVAGPMSGYPELNFPAFHRAAGNLRAAGYEVVNPAEINVDPAAGWKACMRADIAQLVTCDAIALLPGWTLSRGANLERRIAEDLEMGMMFLDGDGRTTPAEWEAS